MASRKKAEAVLPGDLIQVTAAGNVWRGQIGLVRDVRRRGIGVDFLAVTETTGRIGVKYERFNTADYAVCGAALILPPDIQRARADAIETARLVAAEAAQ